MIKTFSHPTVWYSIMLSASNKVPFWTQHLFLWANDFKENTKTMVLLLLTSLEILQPIFLSYCWMEHISATYKGDSRPASSHPLDPKPFWLRIIDWVKEFKCKRNKKWPASDYTNIGSSAEFTLTLDICKKSHKKYRTKKKTYFFL